MLSLNLEPDEKLLVSLHDVHRAILESLGKATGQTAITVDVISKMITKLFDCQAQQFYQGGNRNILFRNYGPRQKVESDISTIHLPSVCQLLCTRPFLSFKCPIPVLINNVQQNCLVRSKESNFPLEINNVKLMSGFPVSLQQSSIDGVIYLISKIRLYEGIPKDDGYFPKSLYEEKISKIYDNRSNNDLKSKFCKQFLDWLSKNIACSYCQDALHVRKGREKWRKISVSRKNQKRCNGSE